MLTLLALTLQFQLAAVPLPQTTHVRSIDPDSLRDLGHAHDAQASFERWRRYELPWGDDGGGRCDVHVGRFCWWYEEGSPTIPAEPAAIGQRRLELLAELDSLGRRHPSDPWIAGMRVFYRVEGRQPALADSAARGCRPASWWCTALRAYAAQARGDVLAADSGFDDALRAMPDSTRCTWQNIATLLPGGIRDRYEHLDCAQREAIERRYWMLSTPRLSVAANEWRAEFLARRVLATLLASAVTPHRVGWGGDTDELLLRYGWPIAWSQIHPPSVALVVEPEILGHDPSPSFHYGPREALYDSTAAARDDGWDMNDVHSESRYAHPAIRRLAGASVQLARFRRADSTLLVAAWSTTDDSLRHPAVVLGALLDDGRAVSAPADSTAAGHARLLAAGEPRLAGVELADSASGSLARTRVLFAPRHDSTSVTLSDLLLFRPAHDSVSELGEALARAIPGDTASLEQPIGLYWEAYGADSATANVETAIVVERLDHGFFRGARQRLGLADPDSPIQIRWSDARPGAGGIAARALSLDLSTMPAGRYRITVGVTPATGAGAVTYRDVDLRDR